MNGSDRRRQLGGPLMITLGFVAGAMSLATAAQAAVNTQTVPLNNDQAGFENDCPSEPGDYWHFVTAPNNNTFEFVEITLNVGGTTVTASGADIIPNGNQLDNVFVRVPTGFDHGDLSTTGSFALITPDTGRVRFVLSHLCTVGSTVTTTTAPTTSTTSTTSTTTTTSTTAPTSSTSTTAPTSSTTTTTTAAAVTSTTAPAITTTTTASGGGSVTTTTDANAVTTTTDLSGSGGATTTSVASGGAVATTTTPAAAATTTSVATAAVTTAATESTPLPATGSNLTGTLAVLSLLAITIGGALLAVSRGTRRPDGTVA